MLVDERTLMMEALQINGKDTGLISNTSEDHSTDLADVTAGIRAEQEDTNYMMERPRRPQGAPTRSKLLRKDVPEIRHRRISQHLKIGVPPVANSLPNMFGLHSAVQRLHFCSM